MPSSMRSTQIGMQDVMCLILNKLIRFEPHIIVNVLEKLQTYFSLPLTPPTIDKEKYGWLTRLSLYNFRLLFMTTNSLNVASLIFRPQFLVANSLFFFGPVIKTYIYRL